MMSLPLALFPLLSLLLLAPVLEEAVARAGVQEWLLQHRAAAWQAVLLTALLLGAAHAMVRHAMQGWLVVLPSVATGLAYQRWRSVRICAVLHAGMNALWLLLVLQWPQSAGPVFGFLPPAWRP